MKCQFCHQDLPENARFCFKCNKQITCIECGKQLSPDASICVFCGTEIAFRQKVSESKNHIKYSESEKEKTFEAFFSDETAGNVVETFARFLPIKGYKNVIDISDNKDNREFTNVEEAVALPISSEHIGSVSDCSLIDQIFKVRGDNEVYLHETSLKANSKSDYAGRLTILFLYYRQMHGTAEVKKSEINGLLERTGFKNDGNYRGWMSKAKSLYSKNNDCYCLCRAGEERAKEYLSDIFAENKTDGWKLGSQTKTPAKTTNTHKKHNVSTTSYSVVGTLNLSPSNKISLKDFIEKYNLSSGAEYNVAFVYYLEKIIAERNISPNHIYTCYKNLGLKFPSNIRQSLIDTKNRKGWIDTSNTKDIKLTTVGENAIEHDLKK